MPTNVKPIPEGHRTVAPYLAIKNAVGALDFYKKAFGAVEIFKLLMPDGRLGHAEIRLGDSIVMLSDEFPEYGGKAPETLGGSPVSTMRPRDRCTTGSGTGTADRSASV